MDNDSWRNGMANGANALRQTGQLKCRWTKPPAFPFLIRLICWMAVLLVVVPPNLRADYGGGGPPPPPPPPPPQPSYNCESPECAEDCGWILSEDGNQNDRNLDRVNMGLSAFYLMNVELMPLRLPGNTRTATLAFGRYYTSDYYAASDNTLVGPLGVSWTYNYNVTLADNGSSVTIRDWNGTELNFTLSGGIYSGSTNVFGASLLYKNSTNNFVWQLRHGTKYTFDSAHGNRLASIADRMGNTVKLYYNGNSWLTNATDSAGRSLNFVNDANGRIIQMIDPLGRTNAYSYDGFGQLTNVTDAFGFKAAYGYSSSATGLVWTVTNARGKTHTIAYDTFGKVIAQTNAVGKVQSYFRNDVQKWVIVTNWNNNVFTNYYNEDNRLIQHTDAGGTILYVRDGQDRATNIIDRLGYSNQCFYAVGSCGCQISGQLIMMIDALGRINTWGYETNFNFPMSFTNAAGKITRFAYDSRGNLTNQTDALGHATTYQYDAAGNRIAIVDANNHTVRFYYDSYGNVTNTTDALNNSAQFQYDLFGHLLQTVDALDRTNWFVSNARNGLTLRMDALGYASTWGYDGNGNLTAWTNELGYVATYAYDNVDRLTSVTLPGSASPFASYAYDGDGNRTAVTNALGNATQYGYDPLDRLVSITNALNYAWKYGFDANGHLTQGIDPNNHTNLYAYDAAGQWTAVTNALGGGIRFQFDLAGNVTNVVDARGKAVAYGDDPLNRITNIVYATGNNEAFQRDAVGNVTNHATRAGQTVQYAYDADNRLIQKKYASSGDVVVFDYGEPAVQLMDIVWTAGGALKSALNFSYDADGRLTNEMQQITTAPGHSLGYPYDAAGRRAELIYPSGKFITYQYNSNGWLTAVLDGGTNAIVTYTYDAAGRRTQRALQNNTFTVYGYDNANELTNVWHRQISGSTTNTISLYQYGYDAAGNRLWVQRAAGTGDAYKYDAVNQLTNVLYGATNVATTPSGWTNAVTYSFDAAGNRTSVVATNTGTITYTANQLNEYTNVNGVAYQYDANGNLTNNGAWTYSYDPENRLTKAVNGSTTITYVYDALGRLIERDGNTTGTNRYYYAGRQLIEERDGNDNVLAQYVYGAGIDEPARMTRSGTNYYYHQDASGNVTEISDSTGNKVEQYSYDVYGTPGIKNGGGNPLASSALGNRLMFQGRDRDPDTGLYNLRNRYYSPAVGRFMQTDPLRQRGGINLYTFAGNSPVMGSYPFGLDGSNGSANGNNTGCTPSPTPNQAPDPNPPLMAVPNSNPLQPNLPDPNPANPPIPLLRVPAPPPATVLYAPWDWGSGNVTANPPSYSTGVGGTPLVPVIITQPASQTVIQGSNVTFTVIAAGTAPLAYQWRLNGTNLVGATGSSYIKTNVQPSNGGSYSVKVSNLAGNVTSATAILTVVVPPAITVQPQPTNQTVVQGANVIYGVTATGTQLTYQWRFNGTNIAGATSSTFVKVVSGPSDAGSYSVVVTNLAGSVTSSVVSLSVIVPPIITAQPANQMVIQGSNATFSVSVSTKSTTPLSYQWYFNATNLLNGATNTSLALVNIQATNTGNYSVIITNIAGKVTSSNALLSVGVPPSIINLQPANQSVVQGANAAFTVTAAGTTPLSYQWRFNGVNISGATTSTFTKVDAQPGDAGSYNVVVTNWAGSVTSGVASLTVNIPPMITAQPTNQTVILGANVSFSVNAVGTTPLSYQWQFNGTNIAGATGSSYTTNNVQLANAGTYSVVVTNVGGSVTSAGAILSVVGISNIISIQGGATNILGTTYTLQTMPNPAGVSFPNGYPVWTITNQPGGSGLSTNLGAGTPTITITPTNAGSYFIQAVCGTTSTFKLTCVDPTADSDYDGVDDWQEILDGTDPNNPTNALPRQLGSWRFDDTNNWTGLQGQKPLAFTNIAGAFGVNSNGLRINSTTNSYLIYRESETSLGVANINCRQGSVSFWFSPDWNSGGNGGPQRGESRLIEFGSKGTTNGCWGLYLNTNGTSLYFCTQTNTTPSSTPITNLTTTINWSSNYWHFIALTYTPTNSCLYIDALMATNGTGVSCWPSRSVRTNGFCIGSSRGGTNQACGRFDNFGCCNYPQGSNDIAITYSTECFSEVDVMLVIDTSGSMGETNGTGGNSKLKDAKIAATNFISHLSVNYDRAGLVTFSNISRLQMTLTTNFGALDTAILSFTNAGSTAIDTGISNAMNTLITNHNPYALPVMVLMTDGSNDPASTYPITNIYKAAIAAKTAGIRLITVALGTNADAGDLYNIASPPGTNNFYDATNSSVLTNVFNSIADLLCRTNESPSVYVVSPTNYQVFNVPNAIPITASAFDPESALAKVEFYWGVGTNASTATNDLGGSYYTNSMGYYAISWNGAPPGTNSLQAVVFSGSGLTATSAPVVITVVNPNPTIQITNPINQTFLARTQIPVQAAVIPAFTNAPISWVKFFFGTNAPGTNSLGSVLAPINGSCQVTWDPAIGGTYVLTAEATDSRGSNAWSAPVTNFVRNIPAVTITSPTNYQIFLMSPTNLTVKATAIPDPSTIVTNVTFYQGTNYQATNIIGVSTSGVGNVYSITWNGVTNGTYRLSAKAFDTNGGIGFSTQITITVETNRPPSVYAGPDLTTNLSSNPLQLVGMVSDDGLPYGTLSVNWTNISGPTNVTLTVTNLAATSVYFYATGVYQFQLSASDGQYTTYSTNTITILNPNLPPVVHAGTNQMLILPALANTNPLPTIKLTTITTATGSSFNDPKGIDYYIQSNCVIVADSGVVTNFNLVTSNGTIIPFTSSAINLADEIYIATVRNTLGGFTNGEMFTGNGNDGEVMRIEPNGTTIGTAGQNGNAWLVLSNNVVGTEPGLLRGGLWVDRTGVWGGNLIVSTTAGDVWRVNSAGQATLVTTLSGGDYYEGITTIPNNVQKYGPWAGRILVGGDGPTIFAVDTNGYVTTYNLGMGAEDIRVIPENENFFGVGDGNTFVTGAVASEFQGMAGDILIASEDGFGSLHRIRWNGTSFDSYLIATAYQIGQGSWEQVNFAPAGIGNVTPVDYVQLHGVVTDDGLLFSPTSNSWIQVSGPGPVTFDAPTLTNTLARFTEPGTYYLRLSAYDGQFLSYDETRVDVIRNQAPVVNAGTNFVTANFNNIPLTGSVSDDGWPSNQLTMHWSLIGYPQSGVVNFSWTNQIVNGTNMVVTDFVSFNTPGTYVLRLTADDGQANSSAEVTVTVATPSLTLMPNYGWPTRTNTSATFTATLVNQNNQPMVGSNIVFSISTGNGSSWTTNAVTDSNGNAWLIYTSATLEQDYIQASNVESGVVSPVVIKDWGADLSCGSSTYSTASGCWSLDWPTNEIHYSDYYLIRATAGSPFTLNYLNYNNAALVLRDPSNNIVAVDVDGFLTYTPLLSGDYLIEMTDVAPGETPSYQLTLSCGTTIGPITAPQIQVLLNGTNVPSGGTIVFSTTVPGSPTNLSLTITNFGTADLIIGNVLLAGDFTNVTGTTYFDIPAGMATNLQLGFNASSNETCVGELLLQHNAQAKNYVAYLVGNAFPTGAPPTVVLTSPANGTSYYAPATIPMVAQATSSSTNISYVDFKEITTNGIVDLGQVTAGVSNNYTFNLAGVPAGDYGLTAVAVDAVGRSAVANLVTVHVLATEGNHPPVANLDLFLVFANSHNNVLNPLANDYDQDSNTLTITSLSSRGFSGAVIPTPDGGTAAIIPGGKAITYTPAPATHSIESTNITDLSQAADGFSYDISDGHGGTARGGIYIGIFAPPIPVVTITNPPYPPTYQTTAGALIPLTACVSNWQYVTKVDFYIGEVLIGEVTNGVNGSYTLPWTASYDACGCPFVASASDSFGQLGVSPSIYINVNPPNNNPNGPPIGPNAFLDSYVGSAGTQQPLTDRVTIQDGIFTLYGRAYHPLGSNDIVWQLGVYTPDGQTLIRDLTPGPLTNGYHGGTVGPTSGILVSNCDLTALQNGTYDLKLTVIGGLMITNTDVQFLLDSNLKLGQFSFSQQDLVIPVNGIPLTVTRTYNSLNPDKGDFGYGWTYTLGDMDVSIDETRDDLQGDDDVFNGRTGGRRDVTLTLPNGQRTTFFYDPGPVTEIEYPNWDVPPSAVSVRSFEPLPGSAPEADFGIWQDRYDTGQEVPYELYDFPGWTLTMKDGTQYVIRREDLGYHTITIDPEDYSVHAWGKPYLAQIIERNLNTITINRDGSGGITSVTFTATNGATRQVVFNRDSISGLITSISDPNGLDSGGNPTGPPAVKYEYDNNDNLMNVERLVDRNAGSYVTNTFLYLNPNFPHYITSMFNGDGTQVAENFYDDSGKLIAVQDANGNLTQFIHNLTNDTDVVIDRLGHTNTYVYDLRSNIIAETNALGQVTFKAYDNNNNKTNEIVYLNGQPYATNSYVYDLNLNLPTLYTDPLRHTISFAYDSYGDLTNSIDANGNSTTNTYDSSGNLISVSDSLGDTTHNSYNGGLLMGSSDAIGTITTNYYDPTTDYLIGTATLDASGAILSSNTFAYDANGNRTNSIVWRRVNGSWTGASITYIYDAMNRVVQTIDPDGGTNTVVYDLIGRKQATIDKLGRTNNYTYDDQGRLIQTTYPDGTTESSAYDANGNRTNSVDRAGRTTTYVYDALNRLTQTIYPDGTTNTTVYDDVGRVAQTIDARGTITAFAYDAAGRRLAVTNAFGTTVQTVSTYGYDANGNQITFTDANNHATTNVFDALNRQVQVLYPNGTKTAISDDAEGRQVAETNQDGIITLFGYDGVGRLTSVTNALKQVTRYQYDEAGNEIAQIDALNRTNTFAYDGMGRHIAHTLPGGQKEGFAYDAAGNLIYQTNFNGVVITNQYDAMNRLTNRASVNSYQVNYTYTLAGQRQTMTDPSGTTSYNYDNRDRLLLKTMNWSGGLSVSLNYLYDANGNVTNIWSSTANGVNLAYSYDPLSRLTNVLASGNEAAGYGFDSVGNLQTMRYANGVTNQYQYDSLNRLTNLACTTVSGTIASFYYQLGLTGYRTNLSEKVGLTAATQTYAWQYDNLYRMTNENLGALGNLSYSYDPVGNRTNRTTTGSGLSRLLPSRTSSVNTNDWLTSDQYDSNGNTTNSASVPYRYDVKNRLIDYNNGAVTLGYNGDGIRVLKNVGGQVTYYVVDDRNPSSYAQVLEEITAYAGATNLTKVYAYGLDLISQRQPGISTNFYGHDGHGSVRFLTSTSGGITDTYTYDAYGTLIASSGSTANNYLYCGEQYDPHLKFYYLRARYLNPDTGRFWTMDTHEGDNEDPLSLHRYLYASCNPVNRVDPSGQQDLISLMVSTSIAASLDAMYNSAVVFAGLALQHTIIGVQNHLTETAILEGYFEDVAIGMAIGIGIGMVADIAGDMVFGGEVEGEPVEVEVNDPTVEGSRDFAAVETTTEDVMGAVGRATKTVEETGAKEGEAGFGTKVHTELKTEIDSMGNSNLRGEISYKGGKEVDYGTEGSVRLDVVKGAKEKPEAIWDLKTGKAKLTAERIKQIRSNLPPEFQDIPIAEIRLDGTTKTY